MSMKVCELVRLTKKVKKGDDIVFQNSKEGRISMRKRVVVSEETVKESEDTYESTGLLYVVNQAATAARDKIVAKENKEGYVDDNQYDAKGFDANGYNKEGFDKDGFDVNGFDAEGYDAEGKDSDGNDKPTL